MIDGILRLRLANYGYWVLHDAEVGPAAPRCLSIESRHIPDAGDVFDAPSTIPCPDVADAEVLHGYIKRLDHMQQYCLIARIMKEIGMMDEYPAVFRMKRVGDYAMDKMANAAESLLSLAIQKQLDIR